MAEAVNGIFVVASAITKNDPFVLRKSDPHREHGLARANELFVTDSSIIHAEGVPVRK